MTEFILKAHNYAEYKLCCRCFSRNFSKIFRTVILKEDLPKDVPYIIEDHLWMSASNETTPQKNVGGSKPSQSRIQAVCETIIPVQAPSLWLPKNTQRFLFPVAFRQENVE